jgi:hypothetical protein
MVSHFVEGFRRFPDIHDHYAIVASGAGVRYAPGLLAANGMHHLSVVRRKMLVRVPLPFEEH